MAANSWLSPTLEKIGFSQKEGEPFVSTGTSEDLSEVGAGVGTEETGRKAESCDDTMMVEMAATVM